MAEQKLTLVADLPAHEEPCWNVAWSHDGKLLASCGSDKAINIWNFRSSDQKWVCRQTIEGVHDRTVRCVSFNPLGNFLAAASFDSTVSVYEEINGQFKQIAILEGHENEVKSVDWDPSGALLVSCSRDKSVWVWEMENDREFECVAVLSGHTQDVKVARWHPHKEIVLSGSYDDSIKAWTGDEDDWFCITTIGQREETNHTDTVWDISFNQNGSQFVSVSADKTIRIWEDQDSKSKNWILKQKIENLTKRPIYSVSWSKQDFICFLGESYIFILKKDPNGSFQLYGTQLKAHATDVNCVRWNPTNSNLIASCGDDGHVKIWNFHP